LIRGMFGFGAIGGFLWAVQLLPLNDAQVLSFTAPIWAALLSPLLLGERPSR
jgi:drug/metabolite transporter (DMT)-like permease